MKKMTRKHYLWMIWIIIINIIVGAPYVFSKISVFKELIENKPIILLIASQIVGLFYWILLLYYFKLRRWDFSFYSGLSLAVSGSLISILVLLDDASITSMPVENMAFIGLFFLISFILYAISFFATDRTKNLKLIRLYAILTAIIILFMMVSAFFPDLKTFHLEGILTIVASIVLILHFIRERHIDSDFQFNESDEILDSI